MVVRVVRDWPYPANFFRQLPNTSSVWEEVVFTEEKVDQCDYLIVLQRPPYNIKVKCPEGNAWLITQEPPVDYFRFFQKAFPHFDRIFTYYKNLSHPNYQTLQPVLPWHVHKSYDELSSITREDLEDKKDELTWITSSKNSWPGHKARMLLKDTLVKSKLQFHLMGNGFHFIEDKFDGLFPYKYALAIENYSCQDYWTEKLADCFLSWCLPFYWGAPNITAYFPLESMIRLDPNHPAEAVEIIRKAMVNKEWEKRLDAIAEARNLILDKYQFFPYIANMVKKDQGYRCNKPLKEYVIPANSYPYHYKIKNQLKYYHKRVLDYINFF